MKSFFRKIYQNTIGQVQKTYHEQLVIEKYEQILELGQSHYAKRFELAGEILEVGTKDLSIKADCYQNIAYYHAANKDMKNAKAYYEKAEKLLSDEQAHPKDKAILLMEIATFHERLHQYELALNYLEKAEENSILSDDITLTLNVQSLRASVYLAVRNREMAEKLLTRIVRIREELKHYVHLSHTYSELGELYENYGDRKQAENCYLKALEYHKYSDEPRPLVLYDLMNFYRRDEDYQKVKAYIDVVKEDERLKNSHELQLCIFQYLVETEQYDEALELFKDMKELYVAQHFIGQLTLYATTFRLYRALNDFESGALLFEECLSLVEDERLFEAKWLLFDVYGEFLRYFEKHGEALDLYQQSAQELLQFRQSIPMYLDRLEFFEDKVEYLYFYTEYAADFKKTNLALFFLESAKGQTLIDLLDTKRPLEVLSFKEIKAIL